MSDILIIKTGALGDVLRTTSILPGLRARDGEAHVTWVTAPPAVDLVRLHPLVERVVPVDFGSAVIVDAAAAELAGPWDQVISLDDEEPHCRFASRIETARLTGATWDEAAGARRYTADAAPWFDMGLLSVHGKERADRLKLENRRTHADLLAEVVGVAKGAPELPREPASEAFGRAFAERRALHAHGPVLGLNTGAGGRWTSKALSVERTAEVVREVHRSLRGEVTFLLLGGRDEAERNARILEAVREGPRVVDGGTDNALLEFAALVGHCDLLLASDSLALHVAVARRVPVVAFFAPTSAAEIDLFGRGEKVVSTAPDYCSYRPDADTSTLTAERIAEACLRQLP